MLEGWKVRTVQPSNFLTFQPGWGHGEDAEHRRRRRHRAPVLREYQLDRVRGTGRELRHQGGDELGGVLRRRLVSGVGARCRKGPLPEADVSYAFSPSCW